MHFWGWGVKFVTILLFEPHIIGGWELARTVVFLLWKPDKWIKILVWFRFYFLAFYDFRENWFGRRVWMSLVWWTPCIVFGICAQRHSGKSWAPDSEQNILSAHMSPSAAVPGNFRVQPSQKKTEAWICNKGKDGVMQQPSCTTETPCAQLLFPLHKLADSYQKHSGPHAALQVLGSWIKINYKHLTRELGKTLMVR